MLTLPPNKVTHSGLILSCLPRDKHENCCGYWYAITTSSCTAHTAFTTPESLMAWLDVLNLKLERPIPSGIGTPSTITIAGAYHHHRHGRYCDMPRSQRRIIWMSNARYTVAHVKYDSAGVATVHSPNVNDKARPEIPYQIGNALTRAGLYEGFTLPR